jgi:hypothetical protein
MEDKEGAGRWLLRGGGGGHGRGGGRGVRSLRTRRERGEGITAARAWGGNHGGASMGGLGGGGGTRGGRARGGWGGGGGPGGGRGGHVLAVDADTPFLIEQ